MSNGDDRWLRQEIRTGRCFEAGLPGQTPHLWIIASVDVDGDGTPVSVVLVNLTTLRQTSDTTVVLQRGDHPYVTRDSAVAYDFARVTEAQKVYLLTLYAAQGFREDLDPHVLTRIQCGVLASPRTPPEVKRACRGRFACD